MSEAFIIQKDPFDLNEHVKQRVWRACQNPFFSIFREESTRQFNAVTEAHINASSTAKVAILDDGGRLLCFPFQNGASIQRTSWKPQKKGNGSEDEAVALIGADGFFGKFVAEQYLQRGISVSVLTNNIAEAQKLYVPIADGDRERRHRTSLGFVDLALLSSGVRTPGAPQLEDQGKGKRGDGEQLPQEQRVVWYQYRVTTHSLEQRYYTLELIEGDLDSSEDMNYALRKASLVYWFPSALVSSLNQRHRSWLSAARAALVEQEAFEKTLEVCKKVDAHLVALSPLWIHSGWLSPLYWYRRMWAFPGGYCRAVQAQERALLTDRGEASSKVLTSPSVTSAKVGGGDGNDSNGGMALLPDGPGESVLRFTLLRLADITYPCFYERIDVAKNNRINDPLHFVPCAEGDLSARLLANIIAKSLALCESVTGSRIDIGGSSAYTETEMRNAEAVFDHFSRLRTE